MYPELRGVLPLVMLSVIAAAAIADGTPGTPITLAYPPTRTVDTVDDYVAFGEDIDQERVKIPFERPSAERRDIIVVEVEDDNIRIRRHGSPDAVVHTLKILVQFLYRRQEKLEENNQKDGDCSYYDDFSRHQG